MSRTLLVVGIGNPLKGADAFGPAVIERLESRPDVPPGVELVDAHTDLLACLDRFPEFDDVIIVDAFLGPGTGNVVTVDEQTFSSWSTESPSSHELSAALVVRIFRRLYPEARTRFVLIGLDVVRVDGDVVSDAVVEAGADAVIRACAA